MWGKPQNQSVESTARRLKDSAAKALGKRKYEQAVEYYLALTHVEPEEPAHRMKLGELYLRLQAPQYALEIYRSALDLFEKQYAFRKAAAVAQIVLEIEPGDLDAIHFLNQWRKAELRPRPLKPAAPIVIPAPVVRSVERTDYYLGEEAESEAEMFSVPVAPPAPPPPEADGLAAADGWGWDGEIDDTWERDPSLAPLDPPMPAPPPPPTQSLAFDGVGSPRTSRRR